MRPLKNQILCKKFVHTTYIFFRFLQMVKDGFKKKTTILKYVCLTKMPISFEKNFFSLLICHTMYDTSFVHVPKFFIDYSIYENFLKCTAHAFYAGRLVASTDEHEAGKVYALHAGRTRESRFIVARTHRPRLSVSV